MHPGNCVGESRERENVRASEKYIFDPRVRHSKSTVSRIDTSAVLGGSPCGVAPPRLRSCLGIKTVNICITTWCQS